ncbi:MAG: peptidase S1, partial [Alphaproteobacteria bacterium]|nr:peptidase S1 [Alphaproteobacteria bacterium]
MQLGRRRLVAGAFSAGSLAAGSLVTARKAGAVVVQDETWRAEGGGPGREAMGFRA